MMRARSLFSPAPQRHVDGYCHLHRARAAMSLLKVQEVTGGDTLELTEVDVGRAGATALAPFLRATTMLKHLALKGLGADGMLALRDAVIANTYVCCRVAWFLAAHLFVGTGRWSR